jgi:hypothetical protein
MGRIMAAWFPSLHPEEPFFSAVARYAEAMAFPEFSTLSWSLYGGHHDHPAAEFPGLLNAFVARLPPGHGHSSTGLILRHTPYPYFAPFYPRRRVEAAAEDMRVRRVEAEPHALFPDGHHREMRAPLRYCPACVAADAESRDGVPRWRRVHLLTGVLACPEHRVALWDSHVERTSRGPKLDGLGVHVCSLDIALQSGGTKISLGDDVLPSALAVADDSLWLLRHPQLADSLATVMERHRALLARTGWLDARGRPRHADLQPFLGAFCAGVIRNEFNQHLMHAPMFGGWTRRMFAGDNRPVIPLFHILQWRALGCTAQEFFSGPPPTVIRRVPRVAVQRGPCRNPTCAQHGLPTEQPPVHAEILVVGCPECRALYAERTDGPPRRSKLLRVGNGWMEHFRILVSEKASLQDVARALGASERRVVREAMNQLAWPPYWPREVRRAAAAAQQAAWRRHKRPRALYERQWMSAATRGWGLGWAIAEAGRAFRWMLRFDAEHLCDTSCWPYFLDPQDTSVQAEINREDGGDPADYAAEYGPVSEAASYIRSYYGPPIPVTAQALRVMLTRIDEYPFWGSSQISERDFARHIDTPASFARRRIRWAAFGFTFLNETPSADRIAVAAGLSGVEALVHMAELEAAANQLHLAARGTAPIPSEWVPRRYNWSRALFEQNFQHLLDKREFFRYSFGTAGDSDQEGAMARRGGGPSNIERRRLAGFGEGEGAEYTPWETARSAPSRGKTHRIFGAKVGRMHLLFSDRELWCWYLLEWNPHVRDIREQYPLHDIAETQEIAAELGYPHPVRTRKVKGVTVREDKVMTVDFLVTLAEPVGGTRFVALSVKTEDQLRDPVEQMRTFEKEEITKRYWQRRGIEFRIVTEAQLPAVLVENLSLVFHYQDLAGHGIPEGEVDALLSHLYDRFADAEGVPVHRVCAMMDEKLGLRQGSAVRLVWHAVATRAWAVDMTARLGPERPLRALTRGERVRRIA